jgi:Arc/MetJ-type ribon-helix-helix transcriptional regulator
VDGEKMPKTNVADRSLIGTSEKMTINLGVVDLGQIDLLVREGFYSNRTDLIRMAIRNQLAAHAHAINRSVTRQSRYLGLQQFERADLEQALAAGQPLNIRVVGLVRIADDVSPKLARAAIESISVLGAFHASASVRRALADRMS